jgi:hypothetical protein
MIDNVYKKIDRFACIPMLKYSGVDLNPIVIFRKPRA